jgi:predicted nucleotidyltransferase
MVHVNTSDEFLVGVEDAYVFGSYLTDTELLGDLDIALTFFRKEPNGERFVELAKHAARESGRRFNSYLDFLGWPETKVLLFLKQRSRVFSLHVNEPLLTQRFEIPRRALFSERRPVGVAAAR